MIITGSPVFSDKNEVVAVVSNIRDISEIISLEKESRVAEEILSLYKEEYLSEPSLGPIICESSNTESVFRTALKVSPRDLHRAHNRRDGSRKGSRGPVYTQEKSAEG